MMPKPLRAGVLSIRLEGTSLRVRLKSLALFSRAAAAKLLLLKHCFLISFLPQDMIPANQPHH